MPNIKSAKKRVLVAEARNERNKAQKSALKTAIKKFEAAAVEGDRTEAEGTIFTDSMPIQQDFSAICLHVLRDQIHQCAFSCTVRSEKSV